MIFRWLVAVLLVAATPAWSGEAVVLFDQSLAGSRAEPLLAERVLELLAATKGIKAVTVAGFDEDVGLAARAAAPRSAAWRAAVRKLRHLRGRERHADFEPAFRHLAEDLAGGSVAVLISHGAPEVWEPRLSPMILADDRYRGLNEQYRDLRAAQATRAELLDLLGPAYRDRNAALTAAAAARLRPIWGERLIVWDVSGNSAPLKAWSEAAGARYVAAAEVQTMPAELKRALTASPQAAATPTAPAPTVPVPAQSTVAPTERPWMRVHAHDRDPPPPAKSAPRIPVETSPLAAPPPTDLNPGPAIVTMPAPPSSPAPPSAPPPAPISTEAIIAAVVSTLVGLLVAALLERRLSK